jgi:BlaI family transcriptional regulator, penicillinase repressor
MTPLEQLSALPDLSDSELDVMRALWRAGRLSAREVHDEVSPERDWAYSTTRTVLERMVEKSLVDKTSFHGIYLYRPRLSRAAGLARAVRDFAERVAEVGAAPVVSLFAGSESWSEEEVSELERLLGLTEGGDGDDGSGAQP